MATDCGQTWIRHMRKFLNMIVCVCVNVSGIASLEILFLFVKMFDSLSFFDCTFHKCKCKKIIFLLLTLIILVIYFNFLLHRIWQFMQLICQSGNNFTLLFMQSERIERVKHEKRAKERAQLTRASILICGLSNWMSMNTGSKKIMHNNNKNTERKNNCKSNNEAKIQSARCRVVNWTETWRSRSKA